jgi:hypothetical protein
MWKHCTLGLERHVKQAEKRPWRINTEDGLLLSAPSPNWRPKQALLGLRGREIKHEEGKRIHLQPHKTKQKKMQRKARKSTAPQPHQAKDKRKQDDACRISSDGTQHCPAAMAQSLQAIHHQVAFNCPAQPNSRRARGWPQFVCFGLDGDRCKLNQINHQMIDKLRVMSSSMAIQPFIKYSIGLCIGVLVSSSLCSLSLCFVFVWKDGLSCVAVHGHQTTLALLLLVCYCLEDAVCTDGWMERCMHGRVPRIYIWIVVGSL